MVVRVDEAGDDRGAFCVPGRRTLADQIAHVAIGSDGEKAAVLDRERVCARLSWVDGDDPGVENDQVGGCGRRVFLRSREKRRGDKARSGEREQIAAGSSVDHLSKAPELRRSQSQHELLLVLENITTTGRTTGNEHLLRSVAESHSVGWRQHGRRIAGRKLYGSQFYGRDLQGSKVEGRDKRWPLRTHGSTICSVRIARHTPELAYFPITRHFARHAPIRFSIF